MKILLDNHHGIGDVAQFLSVLDSLKSYYPESTIHMLVKSPVEQQLVELVGGVSKFYYYNPLKKSFWNSVKLVWNLRNEHYDVGVAFIATSSNLGALLFKLIGCNDSIGEYNPNALFRYTRPVSIPNEVIRARRSGYLLSAFGVNEIRDTAFVSNLPEISTFIENKLERIKGKKKVALCIGAGLTLIKGKLIDRKRWDDSNWLELANLLVNNGFGVVLLGGKKEKEERSKDFDKLNDDNIIDFVGEVDLKDSINIINMANAVVAADTGLGFVAGIMNIPVISLLGPSDPWRACPNGNKVSYIYLNEPCSPCYGTERMLLCNDRVCMKKISVDMVYEKILSVL